MTIFLQKNGIDLAVAAVLASIASYGLDRMFPAPDAAFIAIASTVTICAYITIEDLGNDYASKLTKDYGYVDAHDKTTNFIFFRLHSVFSMSLNILSPIFARSIGQRIGIQVPGYLQTLAYFILAAYAVGISKNILDIGRDVYNLKTAIR